jgi:hypothetical protein
MANRVLTGPSSRRIGDHVPRNRPRPRKREPLRRDRATVVNLPFSASIFPTVFLPILLFHAALMIDVREIAQDTAPILALRAYQHLSEQALAVAALD